MADQFGNTVDQEIKVPPTQTFTEAYYAGYRQGQADEHARWLKLFGLNKEGEPL